MKPDYNLLVSYDFGDYLPELEQETPKLMEECSLDLPVIDEADYGDE